MRTSHLTRALAVATAAALALAPAPARAQTFVETFDAPGAAWESGWFGANSNANSLYCLGERGCIDRGNAPTALWLWGTSRLLSVSFNSAFGASLTSLSFEVGAFRAGGRLFAYDRANTLIFEQALVQNYNFDGGLTYNITSTNGISRFDITGSELVGNTNIDHVVATAVPMTPTAVPEPATVVLMASGLVGLLGVSRLRHRRRSLLEA